MGIDTRIFSTETFPVPNTWVFEKFLNLPERLAGQTVSIRSIFNKDDKTPSMMIYLHDNNKYKFKDFSTGISGDAVDLIQHIYRLSSRQDAFRKTMDFWEAGDYESYTVGELIKTEYEVSDFKVRQWNTNDVKYWTQFHLGSEDLELHNVKPLASYTFKMTRGDEVTSNEFSKPYCYGYFKEDGTLYKIYNPKDKRTKFIKVKNYIQGHEQLKYEGDWLVILASLKDLMAFKKLRLPNIECIAPDSENVMINPKQLAYYRSKYKLISVLFDNDLPGKKSALKYHEEYQLPYTSFDVEKDMADCVREHGLKNTRIFLTPPLLKTKNEFIRQSKQTPKNK